MPITHELIKTGELGERVWKILENVSITEDELSPSLLAMMGTGISSPPMGCFKVTNIYVNTDGKLVIKWDTTPQGG